MMVTYPINVRRDNYRGADPKKRAKTSAANSDAAALERYVNALLLKQESPIQTYLWHEISQGCGLSYETVENLGMSIDGGSNGFTAWRHDLTYDQAWEQNNRV